MKIQYIDPASLEGQRVRIYRNLRCKKQRLYSVQVYRAGIGWRLVGHTTIAFLREASFTVSQTGRKRTLETRRKTVHAFIYGVMLSVWIFTEKVGEPVSYHPYRDPFFCTVDDQLPVYEGQYCSIDNQGVLVYR